MPFRWAIDGVLRRLAERVSRGRQLVRRLPERYGSQGVLVSPSAALRFWWQDLERCAPELFKWADELVAAGDVVWDVGANCGLFSFAAACRAGASGAVIAFEPDPWLASLIRLSASRLPADWARIEVAELAMADREGEGSFVIDERSRSRNHLLANPTEPSRARTVASVRLSTLDAALGRWRPPNLLKIDVEGAEARVLTGGRDLLARVRPRIVVEISTVEPVGQLLASHGYRLFDADRTPLAEVEIEGSAWNTLALPGRQDEEHT